MDFEPIRVLFLSSSKFRDDGLSVTDPKGPNPVSIIGISEKNQERINKYFFGKSI